MRRYGVTVTSVNHKNHNLFDPCEAVSLYLVMVRLFTEGNGVGVGLLESFSLRPSPRPVPRLIAIRKKTAPAIRIRVRFADDSVSWKGWTSDFFPEPWATSGGEFW